MGRQMQARGDLLEIEIESAMDKRMGKKHKVFSQVNHGS